MARTWPWLAWIPCTMLSSCRGLLFDLHKSLPLNPALKSCSMLFEPSYVLWSASISVALTPPIAVYLLLAISGASAAVTEWFCWYPQRRLFSSLLVKTGFRSVPTHSSEEVEIQWLPSDNWRFSLITVSSSEVHCNHHQETRSRIDIEGVGRASLVKAEAESISELLQLTASSPFFGWSQ